MTNTPLIRDDAINAGHMPGAWGMHPFTCGNDSNHRPLVTTESGWRCLDCDYTQRRPAGMLAHATATAKAEAFRQCAEQLRKLQNEHGWHHLMKAGWRKVELWCDSQAQAAEKEATNG